MCLIMDSEMHIGTKLDYLFFQSSRLLQASEIQLLKNQCEQERTQILTNLMLSLENPRPAGYMLTGNRPIFLELSLAVSLPTSSCSTSYNEPVLRPNPDALRGPDSIC